MNVPSKNIFIFYSELLIHHLLEVSSGCMPCAPPITTLIIWKDTYWFYFSVLWLFYCPLPENFLPTSLVAVWYKNKKNK